MLKTSNLQVLIVCMFCVTLFSSCESEERSKIKEYHKNGSLKLVQDMKGDLREGKTVYYYENGNVLSKSFYKNDTLDGTYVEYFENGNIKSNVTFNMGVRDGLQINYFPDQRIRDLKLLEDDTAVFLKNYESTGELSWYQVGVEAFIEVENDEFRKVRFRYPATTMKDTLILAAVYDIWPGGEFDTLYQKSFNDLEFSLEVPQFIFEEYDSLFVLLVELDTSSFPETTALVPLGDVNYDTIVYYSKEQFQTSTVDM